MTHSRLDPNSHTSASSSMNQTEKTSLQRIMGQCGLHLTVLFGILRQWSISQAPRDSYVSHHTALLLKKKKERKRYTEEWWRYTEQTVNGGHDSAIYTLQIYPTTGRANREERKEKPGKKKRKGDIRPTARSARGGGCGPGLKGLLWLVRTNKAVWERSGATERQPLVPIIVKSWCLGTHIHTATNVHIQH